MIGTYVVAAVFSVWLLLSIVRPTAWGKRRLRALFRRDIAGLVPGWGLFGSVEASTWHVLVRERTHPSGMTPWRELPVFERRSVFAFWNPTRRIGKGLMDLWSAFEQASERPGASEGLVRQLPLGMTRDFVSRLPRDFRATHWQFAVVKTFGIGSAVPPKVVLVSRFEEVEDRP